jgi:hypothetical protein
MASRFDDVHVTGTIVCTESAISPQLRSSVLKQTDNAVFPIPWANLRVWDAYGTNLPATAATDDLGLIGGTFATAPPMVQSGDCKAASTTRYARTQVIVPECYVAQETLSIVISAGMKTTVSDTSCTVDVECYRTDKISGISADLCATAAQSINSLTFASKTFAITSSTISAGDVLDVRITIACVDGATATAVTPTIAGLDLACDIKG